MRFLVLFFIFLAGCAMDYYPYSNYGYGGAPTYYYRRPGYYGPRYQSWRSYRGYDRPWLY